MDPLLLAFEERLLEVKTYLDFLQIVEERARTGPPKIEGATEAISVQQQKILYASVYLQLYNLVEATISSCIESVATAAVSPGTWKAKDLSEAMLKEWVKVIARTHVDLNYENRLESVLALCGHLVESLPLAPFELSKGGGGNWDDEQIESFSERLGFRIVVSAPVYSDVKRKSFNDKGPLGHVKSLRNQLAHGSISFTQSAEQVSVAQLRDLEVKTSSYLREVVGCFVKYINSLEFLVERLRPVIV